MDLQQLRYFVAVADHGSFTRGAEAAGITQPSISQQIGKLENELGTPLFHRLGRRVELTDVGRELVPRAREVLTALADMAAIAPAITGEVAGDLRIGSVPTIAQCMLPPLVREFVADYPDVELTLHEDDRQSLVHQILDGSIDVAVLSRALEHEQVVTEALATEDFVLALPPSHRLAKRRRVCISDLANERLVLLDQGAGFPNLILDFFRDHDIKPMIACRTSQLATVQAMVAAGLGISFVPQMAAAESRDRPCVYRPLAGHRPQRAITMAWHRRRFQTPATREFLKRLRTSARP